MDANCDKKAYIKLTQLRRAFEKKSAIPIIEKILEKEGDINYQLPVDCLSRHSNQNFKGYTALHFAIQYSDQFMCLLNHGADLTKKNEAGQTVLHMLIAQHINFKEPLDNALVHAVLSAHVTTNTFTNPCNKDGLSHFHIACMTNSVEVVQFFLENGVPVNDCVSVSSKSSPGYSPLHFAVMCTNFRVSELLLAFGANMHVTDASGKTPLHILIQRRMEMFDSRSSSMCKKEDFSIELQVKIQENEKIINMLLENMSSDNESLDSIGLSNFHVACALQDTSVTEQLADQVTDINHCVNDDSKLWPGYTALHFAAHFSISTVEMLMEKGANIELKDSKGLTSLDICIERYQIEEIIHTMSLDRKWKNLLFSDGETKLLSFVSALADDSRFKKFLKNSVKDINMRIPMESDLWPGYTPLHLAVLFAERPKLIFNDHDKYYQEKSRQIARICLSHGADLSMQDSRGRTPLHLAFRLNKMTVVDVLFRQRPRIPNVYDEDNLSHLHIACAASNKKLKLQRFILDNSIVNEVYKGTVPVNFVNPGSTPLHVYIADPKMDDDSNNIINTLLKSGADSSIKDAYGLTPIHWLLNCSSGTVTNKLLKQATSDCVAKEYGISYLHIASQVENCAAIKRFLKKGANVNSVIKYTQRHDNEPLSFLSRYDTYTPLHFSTSIWKDAMTLLIQHGADVFAAINVLEANSLTNYHLIRTFIPHLWKNHDLQNRMRTEFGWTKIHLHCHLLEVDGFEDLVKTELSNVNARVFSNSAIWKGFTPLHVLMCVSTNCGNINEKTNSITKILLENGADMTIMNDEGITPLEMLFLVSGGGVHDLQFDLLLKHHKNFHVNPISKRGISHFHRVCFINDVDAAKEFLEYGADVNQPVDFFNSQFSGYTPLHFAGKLPLIDLLISHGADVHAEDVDGCTPLHNAVNRPCFENLITKFIENGAEMNKPNFQGITPFETALSWNGITVEKLKFFIGQGFHVNSCNPVTGVGYISIVLAKHYKNRNEKNLVVEIMMNESSTNILGRTTLHHLVTTSTFNCRSDDYSLLFEKLIKAGHDIDEQDSKGKTALHLAVEFGNSSAVNGLLMSGADINVLDVNGNSALSCNYSKSPPLLPNSESIKNKLAVHAYRLAFFKLDLNQINVDCVVNACKNIHDSASRDFLEQLATSKVIEMGVRSMRLCDFLSEGSAIVTYRTLNQLERNRIDEYFEALGNDDKLKEIRSILKLQYRKAVKRLELFFPAIESLRWLLGFNLPDLCAENLFQYVRNSDLKNIIRAKIEAQDLAMDID